MDTNTSDTRKPNAIQRVLPIVKWLPRYQGNWLKTDLIAGLAVAALVVPKSLGYAGITGVPLQHGLYAAAAGAIIYALFGTSRQIATGPSSALAAVAASAVIFAGVSSTEDTVALVAAITLFSGLFYLILAIFKMGWISQFLSKAVITGFLFGAAIDVLIGELSKITGTEAEGSNSWQTLTSWIQSLDEAHWATLLVGVVSLVVIFGLKKVAPKVPGALVLVVGGLVAAALLDFAGHGIALVGEVPSGLPSIVLPDLEFLIDNLATIVTAAVALLFIGFTQTAGYARTFASKHQYRIDINQESVAQGMANVGSGLVQGIPVSTSLSASSLNDDSGAKTPIASLITGALILLTLLLLAPLFSNLAWAVLAAIIIQAVVSGMMDVPAMQRLYSVARVDFWIAIAAIFGVLTFGVLQGAVIGVALSIVWLIYVSAEPKMPSLGRKPNSDTFRSLDENPGDLTYPGIIILRVDAGLFFCNADALYDRVRNIALSSEEPVRAFILDCEGINFIDTQGSGTIGEIIDSVERHGAEVWLTGVKPQVSVLLRKDGIIDRIGEDHLYGLVYEAVEAQLQSDAGSSSANLQPETNE